MLYEIGDLTEEQAKRIIGEKMLKRINLINAWIKENGYTLMIHSTWNGSEDSILEKGVTIFSNPNHSRYDKDTRMDILRDSNITSEELTSLEEWAKNHSREMGELNREYETKRIHADTLSPLNLTAKRLLEYNHRGGNMSIILCVPQKKPKAIGAQITTGSIIESSTNYKDDLYQRLKVACKQGANGELEYYSRLYYPTQGILMAFDRNTPPQVKLNGRFDETYYLDSTTPQTGKIQKGSLMQQLRQIGRDSQRTGHGSI